MDIGLILKDFGGYIQKKIQNPYCKDEEPINISMPRPSFKIDEVRRSNRLVN